MAHSNALTHSHALEEVWFATNRIAVPWLSSESFPVRICIPDSHYMETSQSVCFLLYSLCICPCFLSWQEGWNNLSQCDTRQRIFGHSNRTTTSGCALEDSPTHNENREGYNLISMMTTSTRRSLRLLQHRSRNWSPATHRVRLTRTVDVLSDNFYIA